jgi:hypothetical protein
MTNDNTNAKDSTMDNFTFGMFADADAYDARKEAEENRVEPMDFGDLLNHNQRNLDEADAAAEAAAAEAGKDGWWEDYDSEDIWFD